MKLDVIIPWLQQQSTQKAIFALLTAVGIQYNVVTIETAMSLFLSLYAVLAGARDKS